ncbi:putative transcriptional regulator, TetR family protein [Nocardia wallacei]|uniref:Putative transcriptional regulator, TetR family protein n=2 Tax=Nocardia wallacei TaxID=480035 RepID=A0A7G1KGA1_9NOCA|nr:putative transcriptional regulator, TetR family protein [Nocardia wallacei]
MVKIMSDETPRTYGGVGAPERRERRRAALLDAALDLLAEGGAGAVTKRAVCARARLNDRYFYEHFADRDTLLEALAEDVTSRGIQAVIAATLAAGPDIDVQIRAAAESSLDFLAADPRRNALLLANSTEVLQRARVHTQHAIADAMAAVARELLLAPAPDPRDIDLNAYVLVSGTLELVGAWLRGEFHTDRDHLVDVIADLLTAGVTKPRGVQRASG